jgi:hypothetical protein
MRLLYHENRSTGSIEEARGHIDSMDGEKSIGYLAGKEIIMQHKI